MIALLAGAALVAGTAPYLLPRRKLTPASGVILWLSVLAARAFGSVMLALLVVVYLPSTALFSRTTGWCVHAVIPFLAAHLGFSGHRLADAAILTPVLVLVLSLVVALFSIRRAACGVRRWLRSSALGEGPGESLVVGGPEIVVAAAGFRRARIVVSTGALASLDEDELAAGLEHERGHIARRHSYLAMIADLLFAVARPLPGSRQALDELRFHLERDADEYAVARTGDPLALAASICKAARSAPLALSPSLAALSGASAPARLHLLLNRPAAQPSWLADRSAEALALVLCTAALLIAAALPAMAQAGVGHAADIAGHCPH